MGPFIRRRIKVVCRFVLLFTKSMRKNAFRSLLVRRNCVTEPIMRKSHFDTCLSQAQPVLLTISFTGCPSMTIEFVMYTLDAKQPKNVVILVSELLLNWEELN
ncbi:unnamed protein product [Hymenolepis diminuta]|uniref:Uncharacterized protein n=1 Tax=Hymenolepis diminuta TaxID=6216 RepID=A0A564XZ95_HYMDI|nr:unnamed protein product [Hymenolepis diminuta]